MCSAVSEKTAFFRGEFFEGFLFDFDSLLLVIKQANLFGLLAHEVADGAVSQNQGAFGLVPVGISLLASKCDCDLLVLEVTDGHRLPAVVVDFIYLSHLDDFECAEVFSDEFFDFGRFSHVSSLVEFLLSNRDATPGRRKSPDF